VFAVLHLGMVSPELQNSGIGKKLLYEETHAKALGLLNSNDPYQPEKN
jgi:ribosomal protein S18 acetylase RimI-like enzyme